MQVYVYTLWNRVNVFLTRSTGAQVTYDRRYEINKTLIDSVPVTNRYRVTFDPSLHFNV